MAVLVTYEHPTQGSAAVATPTAVQVADLVTFNVSAASADILATTAGIAHNMNISAADLALGFPEVIIEPLYGTTGTIAPGAQWVVSAKGTNTIALAKTNATGGDPLPTVRVHVLRPHTIGR